MSKWIIRLSKCCSDGSSPAFGSCRGGCSETGNREVFAVIDQISPSQTHLTIKAIRFSKFVIQKWVYVRIFPALFIFLLILLSVYV